jgi:L-asparaginase
MLPLCRLIATGGTIAMKNDPTSGAPVPAVSGEDLLATVPGITNCARLEVENLANAASANMNEARWRDLYSATRQALDRPEIAGVVISHGTDTLEETAWFLALTISSDKPVVLTGAQRNHSDADFDGPRNLQDALAVAVSPTAGHYGVMLVMHGQIHGARGVTKTHSLRLDSFQSGETGVLGTVHNSCIGWTGKPQPIPHLPLEEAPLPAVEIIPTYAGVKPTLLAAAQKAGCRAVVITALGLGNVNEEMHDAIAAALEGGMVVVISTRVPEGGVLPHYGYKGGGHQLQQMGAILAGHLPPHKARVLLMLALQRPRSIAEIRSFFA